MFPRALGWVRSVIVALLTIKAIAPPKPVGPLPHDGQLIPKSKSPVPSPLKAPVAAASAGAWAPTMMSPYTTPTPLNLKI